MTKKGALNYVFCNSLALVLTILLAVAEAEGKGGGKSSTPTSTRRPPASSPTPTSSGSKGPKTTKIKDKNSKVTRCYNEQMVEISCPVTKSSKIAGYVVGGIFAVILLFFLYKKTKGRRSSRAEDLEEKNCELEEEDKKVQQTFDKEKEEAGEVSGSSGVPPPQYVEKVAEEPTEPVPPIQDHPDELNPPISMPVPELAQPNYSPELCMTRITTNEPLPMPVVTPSRKHTLADKFKNVLQKAKRTTTI